LFHVVQIALNKTYKYIVWPLCININQMYDNQIKSTILHISGKSTLLEHFPSNQLRTQPNSPSGQAMPIIYF